MRSSTVGSCASAGKYSFCTIDCGTCQVGLTVMYFIVSLSSGVGMPGLPITIRVAEVARVPAPALHVHDHGIDLSRNIALRSCRRPAQFGELCFELAIGLLRR